MAERGAPAWRGRAARRRRHPARLAAAARDSSAHNTVTAILCYTTLPRLLHFSLDLRFITDVLNRDPFEFDFSRDSIGLFTIRVLIKSSKPNSFDRSVRNSIIVHVRRQRISLKAPKQRQQNTFEQIISQADSSRGRRVRGADVERTAKIEQTPRVRACEAERSLQRSSREVQSGTWASHTVEGGICMVITGLQQRSTSFHELESLHL